MPPYVATRGQDTFVECAVVKSYAYGSPIASGPW